jgi:hypothetical protein
LGQDEETKVGPNGTTQEEDMNLKNHKTSEVEQLRRWRYKQINHRTLEEGVRKRKKHNEFMNKNMWRLFQ